LPTSWLGRHYRGQGTSKTPVANGGGEQIRKLSHLQS
jgi:hypothetical protein